MNIGMVMKHYDKARLFQEGLALSGNEVTAYHDAQECIQALLTAKFNGQALPHATILVDIDLGAGIDGAELIRRVRQHITKEELQFIVMTGRSARENTLVSANLLDIRTLYNDPARSCKGTLQDRARWGERVT